MKPRAGFEPATSALPTQPFNETLRGFELFCSVDLQLSPVTVKDHRDGIRRALRRMNKKYNEVTKDDFREYLFKFKQNHAPATVAGVLKTLKVFYRDFLGFPNLVDSFKFPHIPYRPKIISTKEELCSFFEVLDSKFAEALFLFYASSGLRKGEVLELKVEDVDFEKRMIVPKCHAGVNKRSYVSFYNARALKLTIQI
jgi:integrase